jgi:hypothetical protein
VLSTITFQVVQGPASLNALLCCLHAHRGGGLTSRCCGEYSQCFCGCSALILHVSRIVTSLACCIVMRPEQQSPTIDPT